MDVSKPESGCMGEGGGGGARSIEKEIPLPHAVPYA